jgi:hypothetical protein
MRSASNKSSSPSAKKKKKKKKMAKKEFLENGVVLALRNPAAQEINALI